MVMLKMLSNTTPAISVLFATSRKGVGRVPQVSSVTSALWTCELVHNVNPLWVLAFIACGEHFRCSPQCSHFFHVFFFRVTLAEWSTRCPLFLTGHLSAFFCSLTIPYFKKLCERNYVKTVWIIVSNSEKHPLETFTHRHQNNWRLTMTWEAG